MLGSDESSFRSQPSNSITSIWHWHQRTPGGIPNGSSSLTAEWDKLSIASCLSPVRWHSTALHCSSGRPIRSAIAATWRRESGGWRSGNVRTGNGRQRKRLAGRRHQSSVEKMSKTSRGPNTQTNGEEQSARTECKNRIQEQRARTECKSRRQEQSARTECKNRVQEQGARTECKNRVHAHRGAEQQGREWPPRNRRRRILNGH